MPALPEVTPNLAGTVMPDLSNPLAQTDPAALAAEAANAAVLWDIPAKKSKAEKVGFMAGNKVKRDADAKVAGSQIWYARPSDPREAAVAQIVNEVSAQLKLKKAPKVILYKSDRPEVLDINKKNIAIATNMVDVLSPDELKAMVTQKLEARNHSTSRGLMKWVGIPTLTVAALTLLELPMGKFFPRYSMIHNAKETIAGLKFEKHIPEKFFKKIEPKQLTLEDAARIGIVGKVAATIKTLAIFPIESMLGRRHEIEQDKASGKLNGQDTMLSALETINQREQELESQGVKHTWMKRITPQFMSATPKLEDRIASIRKNGPTSLTDRATAQTEAYAGKS